MRKVETQRVSKLAPLPHHELIDVNDFDRRIEEQRKAGFYALSCEVLKPAAYRVQWHRGWWDEKRKESFNEP